MPTADLGVRMAAPMGADSCGRFGAARRRESPAGAIAQAFVHYSVDYR